MRSSSDPVSSLSSQFGSSNHFTRSTALPFRPITRDAETQTTSINPHLHETGFEAHTLDSQTQDPIQFNQSFIDSGIFGQPINRPAVSLGTQTSTPYLVNYNTIANPSNSVEPNLHNQMPQPIQAAFTANQIALSQQHGLGRLLHEMIVHPPNQALNAIPQMFHMFRDSRNLSQEFSDHTDQEHTEFCIAVYSIIGQKLGPVIRATPIDSMLLLFLLIMTQHLVLLL